MPADIDTLLSLAREVGAMVTEWDESSAGHFIEFTSERELAAYTERIRQHEREKCAVICDEMGEHWGAHKDTALLNGDVELSNAASGEPRAAEALAHLIRSSGTSQSSPLLGGGNG